MSESQREITGVLMAAGMGKRLGERTHGVPKALVEVAGVPMFAHGLAFFREAGIRNIVIVGGYQFTDLSARVHLLDPNVMLIENTAFEMQNGTSLLRMLERVSGNLLVCDCDYIRTKEQAAIVGAGFSETSLFVSMGQTEDPDVMRVAVSSEGMVTTMSKKLEDYQATSAGMFFVPSHRVAELRAATERAIERIGAKDARLEDALLELAASGVPLRAQDIGARDWAEMDTPEEITFAEKYIAENHDRLALYATR